MSMDGSIMPPDLPDHYTHDGSQNHPLYPKRGTINSPRIRAHPPLHSYMDVSPDDGPLWHHPRLDLPSARRILVELFQKVTPRRNERASQILMVFGHFVNRDITRTMLLNESQPMPIECDLIETRGPFCPRGQELMEFYRAVRINASDTGEPINSATTWLDMDHIYGNAHTSDSDYLKYRRGTGGRMKLDNSTGLPPIDEDTGLYSVYDDAMRKLPTDLALTSTFLHYHNRRAEYHQEHHQEWDDETLFWKARMDVIAVYQSAFEEKYITALLGMPLSSYGGYDPDVDASIDVFFSTSSFRYGHSSLSGLVRLLDKDLEPLPQDPMLMRDVHTRTEGFIQLIDGGRLAMAAVLRGLAHDATKAPDASFADDMSLFMEASVVMNIQRGRDNGLPSYNEAKEWFYMNRSESYLDLADGNDAVAKMLEGLYGEGNIDRVDPYVGAMLERPTSEHGVLGPLNEASLQDQFERLRDGDRLYYRARLSDEEIQQLPSLSDLVRDAWGEDEMFNFPEDLFAIVGSGGGQGLSGGSLVGAGGTMELFDGDLNVQWKREKEHIDFTMHSPEEIHGGYIGLGWGSKSMNGAEIWFCESKAEFKLSKDACVVDETSPESLLDDPGPFSCCVAPPGSKHVRPVCGGHNYLTVLDSCASDDGGSYVRIRARLCKSSDGDSNCFSDEGDDLDFIAAYNPSNVNAAHGFSRRTSGTTDLALGTAATCSDDSAQAGLFALHGAMLLVAWLVIAPIAIYVARYLKDKPWRLQVHITLVGVIGGMMFTLVTAALVSVEGTAFGTEDAGSATFSRHKKFGLSIMFLVVFMIVTGELRRRRTLTKKTKSVALERAVILSHRCGGLLLVALAWYNCYIGLIQIGPYESDSVEVTFISSNTVSLGYDLEFFEFVRKYLFFPWICVIVIIFIITEIRVSRARGNHSRNIKVNMMGVGNFLTVEDEKDMAKMSIETFLFLTKHGNALSIIDGYVIDIGTFMDVHPGGTNVLQFAVGCDITPYFIGELDIYGLRHKHSPSALRALRPLVKSKLDSDSNGRSSIRSSNTKRGSILLNQNPKTKRSSLPGYIFRSSTIVGNESFSTKEASDQKCIIRLCISLKREECIDILLGTPLPTSTFIFRAVDSQGNAFERPYTASQCHFSKPEEKLKRQHTLLPLHSTKTNTSVRVKRAEMVVYEFFITIVPNGKMSTILAKKRVGKHIMVKGPLASKPFLEKLRQRPRTDICLIAQGTGITPVLQLVDYYLRMPNSPELTLVWFVRERHAGFEDALGLVNRERASENFRYLIICGKEDTPPKMFGNTTVPTETSSNGAMYEYEARQEFLQLYRSKDILHKETVDALLSWVLTKKSRTVSEGMSESEVGEHEPLSTPSEDKTLTKIFGRIGETLRAGLAPTFRGSDLVSFLVDGSYTPSRESALALGRELASKLNLFNHVQDDQKMLLDDADQLYSFSNLVSGNLVRAHGTRHLGLTQGLLVALCGHSSFENDMTDALQKAGIIEDRIFRFPEGSMPLSQLSEFIPPSNTPVSGDISGSNGAGRKSNSDDDEDDGGVGIAC